MSNHDIACPTCGQTFDSQLGGNEPQLRCPACGARFARISAAAAAPPIRSAADGQSPSHKALRAELGRSGQLMLWFVMVGIAIGFVQLFSNLLQPANGVGPAERTGQVIGTIVGLIIGFLPYYFLFRSSQRTSRFIATNGPQDLAAALVAQSGYWKTFVVLIALGFGLFAFFIVVAIALG